MRRHKHNTNHRFHLDRSRLTRPKPPKPRIKVSKLRLTIWLVELTVLLGVMEIFLLPSCRQEKPDPALFSPPRPTGPDQPAPVIGERAVLPTNVSEDADARLPSVMHLAPGSLTARKTQARYAVANNLPVEIVNAAGIHFRLIPPGTYLMGSPESEAGRWEEETQHVVAIRRPFYIGKIEVTQKQWHAVMGDKHESGFDNRPNAPVEEVTWYDAQEFTSTLCRQAGVMIGTYRLPTEEEWEYICRAGTKAAYYFGDSPRFLHEFAEYRMNNQSAPVSVPTRRPNAWGVYNALGNVQEWCLNKFRMYETNEPFGLKRSEYRSLRGGDWRSPADWCRSAERGLLPPRSHGNMVGFRIIREAWDFNPDSKEQ